MLEVVSKWDCSRKYSDNNRDLLRHIYTSTSKKERIKRIKQAAEIVGITYQEACIIGQFDRLNDDRKRRKYGQKIRKPQVDYTGLFEDFNKLSRGSVGKKTSGGNRVDMAAGQFYGK